MHSVAFNQPLYTFNVLFGELWKIRKFYGFISSNQAKVESFNLVSEVVCVLFDNLEGEMVESLINALRRLDSVSFEK